MAARALGADVPGPVGREDGRGPSTYLGAIAEALREEMERDARVFLLGAGEGPSKTTEGLLARFGPARVLDVPGAGDTVVGMAIGAALEGMRPVVELRDRELLWGALAELASVAGPQHYLTGVTVPVVVRAPSGSLVRSGASRPGNPEAWFAHAPGLKVVCPAFPADAKGLLKSAIRDDDPCMFLEHTWIHRRVQEVVPDDPDFTVPIGKAEVKRSGDHVTIVASGAMVHRALEAAEDLAEEGISAEVVDLRTVSPLDTGTILASVAKTARALVLYESSRFLGIGAEVAAVIAEEGFRSLDAPVVRLAPPNTPEPFSPPLEQAFVPQVDDIGDAVRKLVEW